MSDTVACTPDVHSVCHSVTMSQQVSLHTNTRICCLDQFTGELELGS
jgi:hypothetical protein